MKIQIIDTNHIMLVASNAESAEYSNHTRILVDNKDSFVCNSEPSSSAFIIERPIGGSLFNIPLDITNSPFTTDELLIVYLELDDLTYPYVIPCYNNEKLMHHIANKVGIISVDCVCLKELNKAYPIVLYYAFKLSLSILDIKKAITYWNRMFDYSTQTSNCNCNGR